jgi:carbonic anhydrase
MKKTIFSIFILFIVHTLDALTPQECLKKLLDGNDRFVKSLNHTIKSDQNQRRKALVSDQTPFAIILGCSDSRVPPEILFDQGIGDLFIVRVAGNVLGPSEIDSITYAVKALGCSLIVVLGHQNCGAVKAVIQNKAEIIPFIQKEISEGLKEQGEKNLEESTKLNIGYIVKTLIDLSTFKNEISQNKLEIVGAYYPFVSGKVEMLKI